MTQTECKIGNPYLDAFMEFVGPEFDYHDQFAWYSKRMTPPLAAVLAPGDLCKIPHIAAIELRHKLIPEYAFAIPCEEAIKAIAEHSPIVEIGAGTGYWALMLEEAGAGVVAYDNRNDRYTAAGDFQHGKWFDVQPGNEASVSRHADRALFLCWAPYDDPMASNCLKQYRGDIVCCVGEGHGGCTGDNEFHDLLDRDWTEVMSCRIPRWHGVHDYLAIYRRGCDDVDD